MPLSSIAKYISHKGSESFEDTEIKISPLSVNLTALSRRLTRIWRSLIGSPMIVVGVFLSMNSSQNSDPIPNYGKSRKADKPHKAFIEPLIPLSNPPESELEPCKEPLHRSSFSI